MDFSYKKINNNSLFKDFENENLLNIEKSQNYIPLYDKFFKLNENNYNSINLNNQNSLSNIYEKISENKYKGKINSSENELIDKNVFFKFSPLLDPFKYLAGKYECNENLFNLPKFSSNNGHHKVFRYNNTAYVDSFFTYLTSQLYNKFSFIHGLDFYGSYLGIKKEYQVDIGEDVEMIGNSDFFYENKHLYRFLNSNQENIFNQDSRRNKKVLNIGDELVDDCILGLKELNVENLEILNDLNDKLFTEPKLTVNSNENKELELDPSSNSDFSSRSSLTDDEEEVDEDEESESSESESEEENIIVAINKFPVQIISLECCDNTFDSLLMNEDLSNEELTCIILQILMMLITYQKLFKLTHNDLHTNNIMYVKTEKKYLYYKFNECHYKVPTFGKIFKIIDFGRAIYTFNGITIYSDSFDKDGDANSQYNCYDFFDDKKNLVEPNFSFDLCRLGCSIYDFIIDEDTDLSKIPSIYKFIINWCNDDENLNILYKNNFEERYPDFKLYKMIARKVHNHLPSDEIKHKVFKKYIVPRKEIKKGSFIMNIDTLTL